jgi:DNA-binding HxlR family transcriptional regulator
MVRRVIMDDKKFICPLEFTLNIIGGKWKPLILWRLVNNKVMRYGEIKRSINKVTHKVLSNQLKDLENDGIISRREYPEIPPKVEYSLTEKGITLIPLLQDMVDWGNGNLNLNVE